MSRQRCTHVAYTTAAEAQIYITGQYSFLFENLARDLDVHCIKVQRTGVIFLENAALTHLAD